MSHQVNIKYMLTSKHDAITNCYYYVVLFLDWIFFYVQTSEAILSMSNEIIKALIEEILQHVPCLYVLSEIVSVIDMLQVHGVHQLWSLLICCYNGAKITQFIVE